jgi:hypothetical protein
MTSKFPARSTARPVHHDTAVTDLAGQVIDDGHLRALEAQLAARKTSVSLAQEVLCVVAELDPQAFAGIVLAGLLPQRWPSPS